MTSSRSLRIFNLYSCRYYFNFFYSSSRLNSCCICSLVVGSIVLACISTRLLFYCVTYSSISSSSVAFSNYLLSSCYAGGDQQNQLLTCESSTFTLLPRFRCSGLTLSRSFSISSISDSQLSFTL